MNGSIPPNSKFTFFNLNPPKLPIPLILLNNPPIFILGLINYISTSIYVLYQDDFYISFQLYISMI